MASGSTGKRERQRRRVVWDEDNLAHLEETRTPKQKIDEPKTPYHRLSDSEDATALSPMRLPSGGSDTEPKMELNPGQVCSALNEVASSSRSRGRRGGGWTSSEDEGDAGEFEKWMEDRAAKGLTDADEAGPSVSFQGPEDYYGTGKHKGNEKAFMEHRRRHYDEFRRMKVLRSQEKKDAEEEKKEGEKLPNGGAQPPGGEAGGKRKESEKGEQGYWGGGESEGEVKKGSRGTLNKGGQPESDAQGTSTNGDREMEEGGAKEPEDASDT